MNITLDDDAFGDAQIRSKMEMVLDIERCFWRHNPDGLKLDIYAGWYGLVALLLMSRNNLHVGRIRSYDIDPSATKIANRLNRHWIITEPIFQALTADINLLRPGPKEVDMVVNTAVEHMTSDLWFRQIPVGTIVGIQGTDMAHPNETVPNPIRSLDHLMERYPLESMEQEPIFALHKAQIDFSYPGQAPFSRFQTVGRKL